MASFSMLRPASCKSSDATTASIAPSCIAFAPGRSRPVVIHSSALSAPMMRGRRTVPPKPGIKPNLTSGKPILAVVSATRISPANAISQPPPNAKPFTATTVGTAKSSKRSNTCEVFATHVKISASFISNNAVNSVMSAPTIKVLFAERTNTPFTSLEAAMAAVAWSSSSTVCLSNLLTEPCASNTSSAIESSVSATERLLPSKIIIFSCDIYNTLDRNC
mmetsp:Transcript_45137/g.143739  ORF Transcript_45137/g.143739 Transcript_45137/m.143739 type:complete len:220 (+) Transcript_45137:927-1586(+)